MRILIVLMSLITAGVAHADPATHTFAITSAQSMPADCGGGSCSNACKLEATAKNVSPSPARSVWVTLSYPHPGLDPGNLANAAFQIPELAPGQQEKIVEWVNGLRCRDINVRSVKARCDNIICGFALIQVLRSATPKIDARRLDVDPLNR